MALKTYKPTTPGQRGLVQVDRAALYSGKPVKKLTEGLTKSGGRNNAGRITARRRGGGHKRSYRIIDFKRQKFDMEATVERLEYDPNRSACIALITYTDGEQAYIIAPQRLAAGDKVVSGDSVDVKPGNAMPLKSIPIGNYSEHGKSDAVWPSAPIPKIMRSKGIAIPLSASSLNEAPSFALLASFLRGIKLTFTALFFMKCVLTSSSLLSLWSESTQRSSTRCSATLYQSIFKRDNSSNSGLGVLPPETARLARPLS